MNKSWNGVTILLLLGVLLMPWAKVQAATDGFYNLSQVPPDWDVTDASRLNSISGDYDYTYGDGDGVTYQLPWSFSFYGQSYSQITVDTNGNVWFGAGGGSARLSVWNNDLSSYYYGGVFIQRKDSPEERIVIEWQTETYTDEGFSQPNNFEVVLYQTGNIRINYKNFTTFFPKDGGSGSSNDGINYLSISSNYAEVPTLGLKSFSILPSATAIPPTASVFPGSDSFGNVYLGTNSAFHDFVITNAGDGELTIGPISITGPEASEFLKFNDQCSGRTVLPLTSCTTQVGLMPQSEGVKSATLDIPSNDPSSPTLVPLNGIGKLPELSVSMTANGSGTISSSPSGISCGSTCSSTFASGTQVTLSASPGPGAVFLGWSGGGCSGAGHCVITMTADTSVTAIFGCQTAVRIQGKSSYASVQAAYNAAEEGDVIQTVGTPFIEDLVLNRALSITFDGGYSCDFTSNAGLTTVLGSASVNDGSIIMKNICIQ